MLKKDKQAIYEWAAGLSDEKLKEECLKLIDDTLGSQAEEMYNRGYPLEDVQERVKLEIYFSEKCDLLEYLCFMRQINLDDVFKKWV